MMLDRKSIRIGNMIIPSQWFPKTRISALIIVIRNHGELVEKGVEDFKTYLFQERRGLDTFSRRTDFTTSTVLFTWSPHVTRRRVRSFTGSETLYQTLPVPSYRHVLHVQKLIDNKQ